MSTTDRLLLHEYPAAMLERAAIPTMSPKGGMPFAIIPARGEGERRRLNGQPGTRCVLPHSSAARRCWRPFCACQPALPCRQQFIRTAERAVSTNTWLLFGAGRAGVVLSSETEMPCLQLIRSLSVTK